MKNTLFKAVTGIAGVYHVLLAGIGLFLPIDTAAKAFKLALGVSVSVTPEITLITKFTAGYMLAFGVMLLMLSWQPIKNRALAWPALLLFGARFLNRVVLFGTLSSTFGMTASRNAIGSALILFFLVAIWLTMPGKESKESH